MNGIDEIRKALERAAYFNLQAEVVWSALDYVQQHPQASFAEALAYGLEEWIK